MSESFNGRSGLVIVNAKITGPTGVAEVRLALDTGATTSLINRVHLDALGYELAACDDAVNIVTASGVERVPRVALNRIDILGESREQLGVLCHTLPPTASIDGLLGLDFFRGKRLTIDFQAGQITLESPA